VNLHEYQAKLILAQYGWQCPKAVWPAAPRRPWQPPRQSGGKLWVVKAQVHAGGRGKAGGVKLAHDTAAVRSAAQRCWASG